jgi:hypothetical protein
MYKTLPAACVALYQLQQTNTPQLNCAAIVLLWLLVLFVMRQDVGVGDGSLAAAACAGVPHRVERENIKDFLAKKRETFLVQVGFAIGFAEQGTATTARQLDSCRNFLHRLNLCVHVLTQRHQ